MSCYNNYPSSPDKSDTESPTHGRAYHDVYSDDYDPQKAGYMRLPNGEDSDESEHLEAGEHTTRIAVGSEHDESESALTSESDDESGKTDSYSQVLYSQPTAIGNDFDEEHLVKSSSSECSPRYHTNESDEHLSSMKYSRHMNSSSSFTGSYCNPTNYSCSDSGIDTGIKFPHLQQPRSYQPLESQTGHLPLASKGTAAPDDVRLDMDETTSLLPGGSQLRKQTSSRYTRDASPPLRGLDQPGSGLYSNLQSGYDPRPDDRNSLEAQYPGRNSDKPMLATSNQDKPQLPGKSRPRGKGKGKRSDSTMSESIEGHVGGKALDELLAFIGEPDSHTKSGKANKKKVDKKDKKSVEASIGNEKKNKEPTNEKRKKDGSCSKKPAVMLTALDATKVEKIHDKIYTDENNQEVLSRNSATIVQNDVMYSRIILNGESGGRGPGSNGNLSVVSVGQEYNYSERNIDEAIARKGSELTQISSSLYGDDLDTDVDLSQCVFEEDFVRIKTPEPVEEEFKEVRRKKNKHAERSVAKVTLPAPTLSAGLPHHAASKAEVSNAAKSTLGRVPVSMAMVKPLPQADHSKVPPVPEQTKKLPDTRERAARPTTDQQYSWSESAFPSLSDRSSDVSKTKTRATATVQPFSYAAKVASIVSPPLPITPPQQDSDCPNSAESIPKSDALQPVNKNSQTHQSTTVVSVESDGPTIQSPDDSTGFSPLSTTNEAVKPPDPAANESLHRSKPTESRQVVEFLDGFYDSSSETKIQFGFGIAPSCETESSPKLQFGFLPAGLTINDNVEWSGATRQQGAAGAEASGQPTPASNLLHSILSLDAKQVKLRPPNVGQFDLRNTVRMLRKEWEFTCSCLNNPDLQKRSIHLQVLSDHLCNRYK